MQRFGPHVLAAAVLSAAFAQPHIAAPSVVRSPGKSKGSIGRTGRRPGTMAPPISQARQDRKQRHRVARRAKVRRRTLRD